MEFPDPVTSSKVQGSSLAKAKSQDLPMFWGEDFFQPSRKLADFTDVFFFRYFFGRLVVGIGYLKPEVKGIWTDVCMIAFSLQVVRVRPPKKIWWTFRLFRKWQRSELYWYHIFWVNFSSKGLWVGGSYKVIDLSSGNLRVPLGDYLGKISPSNSRKITLIPQFESRAFSLTKTSWGDYWAVWSPWNLPE